MENEIIKEKSCGAVIYKIIDNEIYFLILHMSLGHYSLCKGHVENKESEIETAYREIKEETSLDVTIDTSFREIITYSPKINHIKDVIFFVAQVNDNNINPIDNHDDEVNSFLWLKKSEAISCLTYDNDKNVLNKAYLYITSK